MASVALVPKISFVGAVGTTMQVAREMFAQANGEAFGVVAESQAAGRGTGGRTWTSPKGNLYFTMNVPVKMVREDIVPVLPLAIGIACRKAIMTLIPAADIHSKWPNDIIYQSKKIGGTIVEHDEDYYLFGIGMNVDVAPPVTDQGRESTTINQIATDLKSSTISIEDLAKAIWTAFFTLIEDTATTRPTLVSEFDAAMDRSLVLYERTDDGRGTDPLTAVKLNEWGHLTVKYPDGSEKTLAASYLF